VADQPEIAAIGDPRHDPLRIRRHRPVFGHGVFQPGAEQDALPRAGAQGEEGLIEPRRDREGVHSIAVNVRPVCSVYSATRLVTVGRMTAVEPFIAERQRRRIGPGERDVRERVVHHD
jgi:hypothetical protein